MGELWAIEFDNWKYGSFQINAIRFLRRVYFQNTHKNGAFFKKSRATTVQFKDRGKVKTPNRTVTVASIKWSPERVMVFLHFFFGARSVFLNEFDTQFINGPLFSISNSVSSVVITYKLNESWPKGGLNYTLSCGAT